MKSSCRNGGAALLLLLVLPMAFCDLFDAMDANHDGSIDRNEYSDGITKLVAALDGPLPSIASAKLGISHFGWLLESIYVWSGNDCCYRNW